MVFAILQHESAMGVHVSPSWTPSHPSPHPIPLGCSSAPALSALFHACFKLALVIYFTYGSVHVSMLFSLIIPPSPSEQCRGFDQGKELQKSQVGGGGSPRGWELKGQSQQGWDTTASNWLHLAYLWSILDIFPDLWVRGAGSHHQPLSRGHKMGVFWALLFGKAEFDVPCQWSQLRPICE